ncbi:hypothetical protein FEK35_23415 [Nocardia cyriacigeorgica]|uniref:Uncharacterized protein n=1 Tax=Nocardia cyriacigeorgica TaxID=135487 RepID=A0A5R8P8J6_9NOCA|nr:hypothetical protein [Nocardia cyriacigeorgica]TLG01810.1 hypothetical protein FEK35_23415 [Nocardia cyriacigeorgica]
MTVRFVPGSQMTSDRTPHRAIPAGQDWEVSLLAGKTLTERQVVMALRTAEAIDQLAELAQGIGLTALELVGMAATDGPAATKHPNGRGDR